MDAIKATAAGVLIMLVITGAAMWVDSSKGSILAMVGVGLVFPLVMLITKNLESRK